MIFGREKMQKKSKTFSLPFPACISRRTCDGLEEGGLAGAVGAHDAPPVPRQDLQLGPQAPRRARGLGERCCGWSLGARFLPNPLKHGSWSRLLGQKICPDEVVKKGWVWVKHGRILGGVWREGWSMGGGGSLGDVLQELVAPCGGGESMRVTLGGCR